ncbi:hypothetical protein Nepgr_023560 [Nepenthes gracilis]|uniref:WRC domain-containing protein n=1 Tax=Nepenthes gracilis TaxID=150966 RepID=A0AAD3XXZ4_NEPGR|nr:hypothetical protein Nepgr_023560 [Nepenthes gracilis]
MELINHWNIPAKSSTSSCSSPLKFKVSRQSQIPSTAISTLVQRVENPKLVRTATKQNRTRKKWKGEASSSDGGGGGGGVDLIIMRIRKNAKLSASIIFGSSSSSIPPETLQSRVCQLNRSPWDALSFPPVSSPFSHQAEGDDNVGIKMSLNDSIAAINSESLKLSCEYDEKAITEGAGASGIFDSTNACAEAKSENDSDTKIGTEHGGETTVECKKTDGKSWQCQRAAKEGGSLCEQHLALLRFCHQNQPSVSSVAATRKPEKVTSPTPAVPKRRGRPRKTTASPTNPNEFYYYSGFGPRWGKKRTASKDSRQTIRPKAITDDGEESNDNSNNYAASITPSLPSDIAMEDIEELDNIDDDEEETDGDLDGEICRKRARKAIKSRSLKSLM